LVFSERVEVSFVEEDCILLPRLLLLPLQLLEEEADLLSSLDGISLVPFLVGDVLIAIICEVDDLLRLLGDDLLLFDLRLPADEIALTSFRNRASIVQFNTQLNIKIIKILFILYFFQRQNIINSTIFTEVILA